MCHQPIVHYCFLFSIGLVRVRPFSPSEQARLPAVPTNKFNFTADASLSGPGSSYDGHSPASHSSSSGAIRKVVDVLDERVLVFDPPDAESISKYKRALLPVQAYRRFKDMRYAFDRVFHEDAQQEEVITVKLPQSQTRTHER